MHERFKSLGYFLMTSSGFSRCSPEETREATSVTGALCTGTGEISRSEACGTDEAARGTGIDGIGGERATGTEGTDCTGGTGVRCKYC